MLDLTSSVSTYACTSSGGGGQLIRQFAACSLDSGHMYMVGLTYSTIVRVHNHLVLPGPSLGLVLEFGDVDRKHDWVHCELNHEHDSSL